MITNHSEKAIILTNISYRDLLRLHAKNKDSVRIHSDLCRRYALRFQNKAFREGYHPGKQPALIAAVWWEAYRIAQQDSDSILLAHWFDIREQCTQANNFYAERERDLWHAEHFESPWDDIGHMAQLTIGYCEARAHYYQRESFNNDHPEHDYRHRSACENARHWYIMAEQARILGGTILYAELSGLREFIECERYHSPFTRLNRHDLLPNRKRDLPNYSPKVPRPATVSLPRATYTTPYGETTIACNAEGNLVIHTAEPITLYSIQYRLDITYVEKNGHTYFQNRSRRIGSHSNATTAAQKHMEATLMPFVKLYLATHPHCEEQAQRQQYDYDLATARAEIIETMEKLRAAAKYLDILEGEVTESGFLNPQDRDHLKRMRHLHLEHRG